MLASARSGFPAIVGAELGFSRKSVLRNDSSTAMMPNSEACSIGTSTQPTMQLAQQAVRLVLRQHRDPADVGIEAVRQREIDDAKFAAEEHRGLGAAVGQLLQPAATAAGEHQRDGAPGETFLDASRRQHGPSSMRLLLPAQATTLGRERPRIPSISAKPAAAPASG